MPGPFEVTEQEILRLTAPELPVRMRQLFLAEAQRIGLPLHEVSTTTSIDVPDGGVDATVSNAPNDSSPNIFFQGVTAYQLKAGHNFSPTADGDLKAELFKPSGALKPEIQKCIDNHGTYVMVCSGKPLPSGTKTEAEKKIKAFLEYDKVAVWGPDTIASFYNSYPALALDLKQSNLQHYKTHAAWSTEEDLTNPYIPNEKQNDTARTVQDFLTSGSTNQLRVEGEPGVGKTRAVLEATREEPFRNLLVYFQSPETFAQSGLQGYLHGTPAAQAIVVVDECPEDRASELERQFLTLGIRVRIITIYPESHGIGGVSIQLAERLDSEVIKDILRSFNSLPPDQIEIIAGFCEGLPRAAVLLAKSYRANPGDPFSVGVAPWRRFLYGKTNFNDPKVNQAEEILKFFSLFKKFGVEGQYASEFEELKALFNEFQRQLAPADFTWAVNYFKALKLLQGLATHYISPQVLHLWLWKSWWDEFGNTTRIDLLVGKLSPTLELRFFQMFEYAGASPIARSIAVKLLDVGGPLYEGLLAQEGKSRFFMILAKVCPEEAIDLLERALASKKKIDLLSLKRSRRNIIWTLEWLAQWDSLFERAATLLSRFAEAENESISNNSTGVFVNLFSGYGQVASTEAGADSRLAFLKRLLNSDNPDFQTLALSAIRSATDTFHLMKWSSPPSSPWERRPKLWSPSTSEYLDYVHALWQVMLSFYDNANDSQKKLIHGVVSERLRVLSRVSPFKERMLDDLTSMYEKSKAEELLKAAADFLKYESRRYDQEIYGKIEDFLRVQTERDFPTRFDRYVVHGIESERYKEGELRVYGEVPEKIAELSKEISADRDLLFPLFEKLFLEKTRHASTLASSLAPYDHDGFWYSQIMSALSKGKRESYSFAVSFLAKSILDHTRSWEQVSADLLAANHADLIVSLASMVGAPKGIVRFILDGLKDGRISLGSLHVFGWGTEIRSFDAEDFSELFEWLLSHEQAKISIGLAVSLLTRYYLDRKDGVIIPEDQIRKILVHPATATISPSNMNDYGWDLLARGLIKRYPESVPEFIRFLFGNIGLEDSFFASYGSYPMGVAHELIKQYPAESWKVIGEILATSQNPYQLWNIFRILKGSMDNNSDASGALVHIPAELIFEWVDIDSDTRIPLLSNFIPAGFGEKIWNLIRQILIKYGVSNKLQLSLMGEFLSGGWMGPTSIHLINKQKLLAEKLSGETVPTVKRWIQRFIKELDKQIESEKQREEREY
jgi:hypothetical protein